MESAVVLLSQEQEKEDAWLTVKKTAKFLGLSEWSVRRRIDEGELPAYRTKPESGEYRIKRSDAETYLQRMRVHPPEQ